MHDSKEHDSKDARNILFKGSIELIEGFTALNYVRMCIRCTLAQIVGNTLP